jgi:hypothetical protein
VLLVAGDGVGEEAGGVEEGIEVVVAWGVDRMQWGVVAGWGQGEGEGKVLGLEVVVVRVAGSGAEAGLGAGVHLEGVEVCLCHQRSCCYHCCCCCR